MHIPQLIGISSGGGNNNAENMGVDDNERLNQDYKERYYWWLGESEGYMLISEPIVWALRVLANKATMGAMMSGNPFTSSMALIKLSTLVSVEHVDAFLFEHVDNFLGVDRRMVRHCEPMPNVTHPTPTEDGGDIDMVCPPAVWVGEEGLPMMVIKQETGFNLNSHQILNLNSLGDIVSF